MTFVHNDAEFDALLHIVAEKRGLGVALVEKDYWVTHTLWALHVAVEGLWPHPAFFRRPRPEDRAGKRRRAAFGQQLE